MVDPKQLGSSHTRFLGLGSAGIVAIVMLLSAFWATKAGSSGLRFLGAAMVLIYVPGRLVLDVSGVRVQRLESLSLSLVLGLALSSLFYWLAVDWGVPGLFPLWPAGAAAGYAYRRRAATCRHLRSRPVRFAPSHALLIGALLLGLVPLLVSPLYLRNMVPRPDGTRAYTDAVDAVFHLSVTQELTHAIPPEIPFVAGDPLSYHYGMDLAGAMMSRTAGLDVIDVTLYFMPALFVVATMLAIFCFSRRWLDSAGAAVLVVVLVFFGEDFSFIPGMLRGSHEDWSAQFFSVPTTFSLYYLNPMLPALGVLFSALSGLAEFSKGKTRAWLVLTAFLFSILMPLKVFTAAQLCLALGIAAILHLATRRDARLLRLLAPVSVVVGVMALVMWRANTAGAAVLIIPGHATFIPIAVEQVGFAHTDVGRRVLTLFGTGRVTLSGVAILLGVALPGYLVGSLGVRVLAIPRTLRALFAPADATPVTLLLAVFIVLGPLITLTCTITPVPTSSPYNNSVWFFVQSKYLAWIFTVEAVVGFWRDRRNLARALAVVAVVLLAVPSALQHLSKTATQPMEVIGKDDLAVIDFLRQGCAPGDVVLAPGRLSALLVAMTTCRAPFVDLGLHLVRAAESRRRSADLDDFWRAWHHAEVRADILRLYHVRYVVGERTGGGAWLSQFANDTVGVYQVGD